MADFAAIIRREFKVSGETILHDLKQKKDPLEFTLIGSQMFHGMQGEGKTVSMFKYGMDTYQVIDSGRSIMGGSEVANGVQLKKNGTLRDRRNSVIPRHK